MKYTVYAESKDTYKTEKIFSISNKKEAIETAKRLVIDCPSCTVVVEYYKESTGEAGFVSPKGKKVGNKEEWQ